MTLKEFAKVADMTLPIWIIENNGDGETKMFDDMSKDFTLYVKEHGKDKIRFITLTEETENKTFLLFTSKS